MFQIFERSLMKTIARFGVGLGLGLGMTIEFCSWHACAQTAGASGAKAPAAPTAAAKPPPTPAPSTPAPSAPAPSAPVIVTAPDIVRLKNGGILRGTISELVPGDYVTIVL